MAFVNLLDDPLYGVHSRLVLGWSDDQLKPLADRLGPLLPDSATPEMRLAVAAVARSIVTEAAITGLGVHYSRARNQYGPRPQRYGPKDPRFTLHYVAGAMDHLLAAELIKNRLGEYYPGHPGRGLESVAMTTEQLTSLVTPLIDVSEDRALFSRLETIVIRSRKDKCAVDYEDTEATVAMREDVQTVNDALAELELQHRGRRLGVPRGRRIFNGSFEFGGRFYCLGTSFQNMPADQRAELGVVIDGQCHRMVEIDFTNLHITMAYAEAGEPMPDGDQYDIDGFPRAVVKRAVNTMFNARKGAIDAVVKALRDRPDLMRVSDVDPLNRVACRALAEQVVAAIVRKHQLIKDFFGSDCGLGFQRTDSDMAIEILIGMIQRTGRCPLPVHDSFIVADVDVELLEETMREVSTRRGLRLSLKPSGSPGSA